MALTVNGDEIGSESEANTSEAKGKHQMMTSQCEDQELREIEQRLQALFVAFESAKQDFVRLREILADSRTVRDLRQAIK